MDEISVKRISKNTIALYVRMAISIVVSLFTSRIVLQQLGQDGYGTYVLVGGIVTLWTFLNSSMSLASSRFLSIAIGKREEKIIKSEFSSVFYAHIITLLIIILVTETFGLWFVQNKLNITQDNMHMVNVVYQMSVLSICASVLQTPFMSLCISYEDMKLFAYLEIASSFLKLMSAVFLIFLHSEKIIFYSVFIAISSGIILLLYVIYAWTRFPQCRKLENINLGDIGRIFSFTSWDLFSNGAVSLRMQGVSVLYKLFFGLIANAAFGISLQIQGVATSFANNIATAIRPQIFKSYSVGNISNIENLTIYGGKVMGAMVLLIVVPLIVEMEYVIRIWLGETPKFVVGFSQLILISIYYWSFSTLLHSVIHATGKIRFYSILSGIIVLSELIVIYGIFKMALYAYTPQIVRILIIIGLGIIMLLVIKKQIPTFRTNEYLKQVYLKGTIVFFMSFVVPVLIHVVMLSGILRLILVVLSSIISTILIVWFISFDTNDKKTIEAKFLQPFCDKLLKRNNSNNIF